MLPNTRKGIYHSELVAETQNGPVWMTFTGDGKVTFDSRDGGNAFAPCRVNDQPYVKDGAEQDRYLTIENAAIRAHLDTLQPGAWYAIKALGSRDAALLEIHDAQGTVIPQPNVPAAPPAGPPQAAPPVNRTAAGPGAPTAIAGPPTPPANSNGRHEKVDVLMANCLKSAAFIVTMAAKRAGLEPSDDALLEVIHANAATLFIQASRNGGGDFAYANAEVEPRKPNAVDAMAAAAKNGPPATVGAGSPLSEEDDELPF